MRTYSVIYFGAALIAILGMPLLTRAAKALGLVDQPGLRKVHTAPVPRIGGVVVVFAALALILPVLTLDNIIGEAFRKNVPQIVTLLAGATLVFFIGLIDDIRGLRATVKLVALVVAALAVCWTGARIETISIDPWFTINFGWASWPITVLWIVGITVGINFIDGLDGLAAGISAIVCGTIAVLAYTSDQLVMLVFMLALLGSLTGFLFFNFNPAKVFLGDCGSMFLGFLIGAGSVVCVAKTSAFVGIMASACALGVPILDTTFTLIRRGVLDRRSIFAGERGHIHHRLLDLGLRHRQVVIIIHCLSLVAALLGLLVIGTRQAVPFLIFLGVLVMLLFFFHFVGAARIGETVVAIKRMRSAAQQVKKEKNSFEDAQLRMRDKRSFEGWWEAVCQLAQELDFVWMELSLRNNEGSSWTTVWRRPGEASSRDNMVTLAMSARRDQSGFQMQIKIGLEAGSSLETTGRRARLVGRLLDAQEFAALPSQATEREPSFSVGFDLSEPVGVQAGGRYFVENDWSTMPLSSYVPQTTATLFHDDDEPSLFDTLNEEQESLVSGADEPAGSDGHGSPPTQGTKVPRPPSSAEPPEPVWIMGARVVPFESYEQAVDCAEARITARRKTFGAAINPEKVYRAGRDPALMAVLRDAEFGLCDGVGISIAARLLHRRKISRCTGCDFFFHLIERAAHKGWGVFLLGAAPESNEKAAAKLSADYPGLRIVGRQDGYFEDSEAVVRQINASGAEVLFVAMGSPKQELWISQHREAIAAPFCLGVGGSFDIASGLARRAPRIFQLTGLEYLFQLVMRPGWSAAVKWDRTLARLRFMANVVKAAVSGQVDTKLPPRLSDRDSRLERLEKPAAESGFTSNQQQMQTPNLGRRDL